MSEHGTPNRDESVTEGAGRTRPARPETRAAGRRRFLTGGIAAAPVIVTLSSRSALAAKTCTISGTQSGNTSGAQITCYGHTLGYYKNNPQGWPSGIEVGPPNPLAVPPPSRATACASPTMSAPFANTNNYTVPTTQQLALMVAKGDLTQGQMNQYRCYLPGKSWASVFGTGLTNADAKLTLMQALWGDAPTPTYGTIQGDPPLIPNSPASVLAQCVAAYFNALKYGANFGYTPAEVVNMVRSRLPTDPAGLTADLDLLNSRGAP
jgi:hypothetical protein